MCLLRFFGDFDRSMRSRTSHRAGGSPGVSDLASGRLLLVCGSVVECHVRLRCSDADHSRCVEVEGQTAPCKAVPRGRVRSHDPRLGHARVERALSARKVEGIEAEDQHAARMYDDPAWSMCGWGWLGIGYRASVRSSAIRVEGLSASISCGRSSVPCRLASPAKRSTSRVVTLAAAAVLQKSARR
jgi:hypothetical protein